MNLVFKNNINDKDNDFNSRPVINVEYIHFSEPVQNAIMSDSSFIRIVYSDGDASIFGLMIPMYFNHVTILKAYNKNIIMYDLHSHRSMVSKISCLEYLILERYNQFLKLFHNENKTPVYNLTSQLKSCSIKLFDNIDLKLNECNIILKISGIWENDKEIGITFKFLLLNS